MPHHIKQYVCFNLYLVRMMCMLSQCGVNWYACNSSMVLRHCSALEHEKHQFLVLALAVGWRLCFKPAWYHEVGRSTRRKHNKRRKYRAACA